MTNRLKQVNELIKEELGKIILQEVEFPKENLVTISRTDTTPNLSESHVYVSVIGKDQDQVLSLLRRKIYDIQHILNRRLNMRPIPKIVFRMEKETERAAKIEELIEKIKKK